MNPAPQDGTDPGASNAVLEPVAGLGVRAAALATVRMMMMMAAVTISTVRTMQMARAAVAMK